MTQLTELEYLTIELALCDALACYRFEAENKSSPELVTQIQLTGQVLRKIRKECLKIVERGASED